MKQLIKKVPLPMSGLMLALAAIGNLLQSYGEVYRNIFGLASAVLLILILLKIVFYSEEVKQDLKNPLIASVFPTLTMGLMLLSTYIKALSPNIALAIWIIGVLLHIVLIIKFTMNFLIDFDMKKVFPSWFIVYAGIGAGSVTAPAFGMESFGKVFFWFAIVSYFLLLPIIIKKVTTSTIGEPALATLAIFAAPVALSLAGYINSFESKNMIIVFTLLVLSQLSYIFALTQLPNLLKLKFYPSFSGFTFPLVISAISLKLTNGFLINIGQSIPILDTIVKFEEIIAFIIVLYILVKYIQFLIVPLKTKVNLDKEDNLTIKQGL